MKIVAFMPIKMNNERLPGKNTRLLNGKPLLQYSLDTLLSLECLDSINVFCSNPEIIKYIPNGVSFIQREVSLDLPTSNFNQIFSSFEKIIDADIYVLAHATAPYITRKTVCECINAVVSGEYDSSFTATKIQTFLWENGVPLNFNPNNLPRTQDLNPIYQETSGVYVFKKSVFDNLHRRIGMKPFIKEVSFKEAIDIDTYADFSLAQKISNMEF